MVVTRTTRNRFVGDEPARGFESHHLRQGLLGGFRPQGVLLYARALSKCFCIGYTHYRPVYIDILHYTVYYYTVYYRYMKG